MLPTRFETIIDILPVVVVSCFFGRKQENPPQTASVAYLGSKSLNNVSAGPGEHQSIRKLICSSHHTKTWFSLTLLLLEFVYSTCTVDSVPGTTRWSHGGMKETGEES